MKFHLNWFKHNWNLKAYDWRWKLAELRVKICIEIENLITREEQKNSKREIVCVQGETKDYEYDAETCYYDEMESTNSWWEIDGI